MSELETLTGKARAAGLKKAALDTAAAGYFEARADLETAVRAVGMRLTKGMEGLPARVVYRAADFEADPIEPGLGDAVDAGGQRGSHGEPRTPDNPAAVALAETVLAGLRDVA